MPNLFATSFEGALSPSFDLRCLAPGRELPDGWGVGFYHDGESASCTVVKEPRPLADSLHSQIVSTWENLVSPVFLLHIRNARWGSISDANTQPFARSHGRHDWIFAHSGSLEQRLEIADDAPFEPVGSTDTEAIFCELLSRCAKRGYKRLRDVDPVLFRQWLVELNEGGTLTCAVSDGTDLWAYSDRKAETTMWVWELLPPYDEVSLSDDDLTVDLTIRGAKSQKGVVLSSEQLVGDGETKPVWRALPPSTLLVVRQGAIVDEIGPTGQTALPPPVVPVAPAAPPSGEVPVSVRKPVPKVPLTASPRRLEIKHKTAYHYDKPVERSTHLLRLVPVHDRLQQLVSSDIRVSVDGQWRDYDDVFGNRARRLVLAKPYTELVITARSMVITLDTSPLDFRPLQGRTAIPVHWYPWQRQMLAPYLVPPELPETQLIELHEYAMSFVLRNDHDLVDSLLDLNRTIYTDFTYKQGSTTLSTTPFETYARREGVCQDFSNLFICLARILGIPARYVCGYLYTGPKKPELRAMSEATHAWVQVYLPEIGWKGFDPTNGVVTQTDHIRVAVGRHYMDATPTSGTIFVGGGRETLEVGVTVEEDG